MFLYSIFENIINDLKNVTEMITWLFGYITRDRNSSFSLAKSISASAVKSILDNYCYYYLVESFADILAEDDYGDALILQMVGSMGALYIVSSIISNYSNYHSANLVENVQNAIESDVQLTLFSREEASYDELQEIIRTRVNIEQGVFSLLKKHLDITIPNLINIITSYQILAESMTGNVYGVLALTFTATLLYTVYTNQKICHRQQEYRNSTQKVREQFEENLRNYFTIQSYQGVGKECRITEGLLQERRSHLLSLVHAHNSQSNGNSIIFNLSFVLLGYFKFSSEHIDARLLYRTIGMISRINMAVYQLVRALSSQTTGAYSIRQVKSVLDTKNKQALFYSPREVNSPEESVDIIFSNVSFMKNGKQLIKNLSCEINSGESVAIVGPSGSGKSTFIKLIAGLVTPTRGTIALRSTASHIHDTDIKTRRNSVIISPQSVEIFKRSLKDNIEYGIDSQNASSTSSFFTPSLKINANLNDDIRLNMLSGGEQKFLALLRVLKKLEVTPHPIIILDEPFANIDADNKKEIVEFLTNLKKSLPTSIFIIVSHDDSCVSWCNKKMLIEDGMVKDIEKRLDMFI